MSLKESTLREAGLCQAREANSVEKVERGGGDGNYCAHFVDYKTEVHETHPAGKWLAELD